MREIMPSNVVAEKTVISSCLYSAELLEEFVAYLSSGDFHLTAHQIIFQTIVDLYGKNIKCDAAPGVPLRVEKYLAVDDVLLMAALQVRPGQIKKILLGLQYGHALIIKIKKVL